MLPQFVRALGPEAGQQLREALEGNLVARIGHEFQIRGRVLDVRLFKETDAAGDGERDLLPGQFQLQFQRVKMRAIQHGDVIQAGAFVAQFQRALGDEGRLLAGVMAGHQHGFQAGLARGRQVLGKLVHVGGDGGVGHVEDFRRAAVVGFNLEHFRAGIPLRKVEDVGEIRAAPGVDALRVVAHHHDVVMPRGEQVNQVPLQLVGVLVLVHENELKPALVMFPQVGVVLQQLEPKDEQVVEIHRVGRAFAVGVTGGQRGDLGRELREMIELAGEQFCDRLVGVAGERKNFVQHVQLGEMRAFRFNFRVGNAGLDQVLRIVAVQDGEIALVAERFGVQAQDPRADGVERAAPERTQFVAEQIADSPHHFAGGLVREGQQQNPVGGDALLQQIGHAISERARLAGASPGDHQGRPRRRGDGGQLLGVEFARIVNVQPDFRRERF